MPNCKIPPPPVLSSMESSAAAGHSYSGVAMVEPDTVQSAAAAEIAVHSVSPSRASSAPGNELVAGASTVSEVMEMPINSTMQASEMFEAIAPQDPPTDQVVSQNKL